MKIIGIHVSLGAERGLLAFERALVTGQRAKADAPAAPESLESLQKRLVRAAAADAGVPANDLEVVVATTYLGSALQAARVATRTVVIVSASAAIVLGTGPRVYARIGDVGSEVMSPTPIEAVFLSSRTQGAPAPGPTPRALVWAPFGDVGADASMVALIVAALSVHHGYIAPAIDGARLPLEEGAGFFQPALLQPWFSAERRALVPLADGASVVLANEARPAVENAPLAAPFAMRLVGESEAALDRALVAFEEALQRGDDPARIEVALKKSAVTKETLPFRVVLMGRNVAELTAEAASARRALPATFAKSGEWQTPRGSCLSAKPVGKAPGQTGIAFVYPGAFNAYVGFGRRLPRVFPKAYERLREVRPDLGSVFAEELVYPRTAGVRNAQTIAADDERLARDEVAMIEAGMAASYVYTSILRDTYGVKPTAAFGYSMGELTMLWSLGVWRDGEAAASRLRGSPLFRARLSGPLEAVRDWKRRRSITGDASWVSYVVKAEPTEVTRAIDELANGQAFMSMVSSPSECILAGLPDACTRVLARLACEAVATPVPHVLHARDLMSEEGGELAKMAASPIHDVGGTSFYSAATYAPLSFEATNVRDAIVRMCQEPLDFPRLVRRVHDDGARVFIEVGPGSSCTRLVTAALDGREHLAIGIDRRGADDEASVAKVVARLFVHRVGVT